MKPRPFGLTDAMMCVVAAAVGLWVNQRNWVSFVARWQRPVDSHDTLEHVLDLVTPHLAAMTIAVFAVRMRAPRPPLCRLARQPGLVACAVALSALLVIACWVGVTTAMGRAVEFSEHATNDFEHSRGSFVLYPLSGRNLVVYGDRIGFAVAGAWLWLWISGRWRAEPTWVDRLGRVMGWLWLVLALVFWLRCYSI
jgi:hypothetical protein